MARGNLTVGDISLTTDRPDGIIGRAVIVRAATDDLKTDPTGNAGGRVACGVIKGQTGTTAPSQLRVSGRTD